MPKLFKEFKRGVDDAWLCTTGAPHSWLFRRERQMYLCPVCAVTISKADLKRETDDVATAG